MNAPVEVRAERTPNPNALKFTVNRELWRGAARTVASGAQAAGFPLAAQLLAIPGVQSLFFLRDFVTVTRDPNVEWEPITAAVTSAIEHFYEERTA